MTTLFIPEGKTRLLLVEGTDDKTFFDELISHMERKASSALDRNSLAIVPFGGLQNLVQSLGVLARDPNYDIVSHISIVRDSDYHTDAFASVCSSIERFNRQLPMSGLPVPSAVFQPTERQPHVSIFTMPLNADGTLESVVLSALQDDTIISCVNEYFACIENTDANSDLAENRLPKSKLAVLIAGKSRRSKQGTKPGCQTAATSQCI